MSFISFIITLCLMFFSLSGFALSLVPAALMKKPYKVIGVACLPGETCQRIEKGEFAGYYFKTNVPLKFPHPKDITKAPELENIRDNMFTKAVLNRERDRLKTRIEGLKDLAESCKGDVCIAKYDSKGCNLCTLNVHRSPKPPCFKGPHGAVACPDPDPRAYNINYFCTLKGCTGSPEEMEKLYARAGMCVKYGPNPLPQARREIATIEEELEVQQSSDPLPAASGKQHYGTPTGNVK